MDPALEEGVDLNMTFSSNEEISSSMNTRHLIEKIVVTIVSLGALVANGLIIYVIVRYKKMRTRVNMFMLNWALSNGLYVICVPSSYHLMVYIENADIDPKLICILYELEVAFLFINIVFVALLLVDWYVVTYTISCSIKYRGHFKIVVTFTWIVLLFFVAAFITGCTHKFYIPLAYICVFFGYLILLLITIFIHIFKCVKSKQTSTAVFKSTLSLKLSTIFVLCWTSGLLNYFIDLSFPTEVYFLHTVSNILSYGNSMIILAMMARWDKNFMECLQNTLRCQNQYQEREYEENDNMADSHAIQVSSLITDT